MIVFGSYVQCQHETPDGKCPLQASVRFNGKVYCKQHKPKAEKELVGHYSGRSETPYGSYENR